MAAADTVAAAGTVATMASDTVAAAAGTVAAAEAVAAAGTVGSSDMVAAAEGTVAAAETVAETVAEWQHRQLQRLRPRRCSSGYVGGCWNGGRESNLRGDGSGVEDVCEFVRDCVVQRSAWMGKFACACAGMMQVRIGATHLWPPGPAMRDPPR